jgi:hypothetical protein
MADSPNHATVEGAEDIQFLHINKSETDLLAELQENQSGIATDTKRLLFRNGSVFRNISEDALRNVPIGDIVATEKLHVDGNVKAESVILSKTITDSADANRVRISNRTAYSGSNPTGLLDPVDLRDNVKLSTGTKIKIVPPYEGMPNYGWSGTLYVSANIDLTGGNHYHQYRGLFNVYWTKAFGTEIQQVLETISNASDAIGLSEGAEDVNVFGSNVDHATKSCWIALENVSGYAIQAFYHFIGGLQTGI